MPARETDPYFSGERLYGDDFDEAQIARWFESERNGYADLGSKHWETFEYGYHALNWQHGFRHLPAKTRFSQVLGFGSGYGDELRPILSLADQITIVDPSDHFEVKTVDNVPVRYIKSSPDGILPLESASFDLVTCFGVLHHIPNVSIVARELLRCVKPGGYVLIREPTISMGDWRMPRAGLTANERGIPLPILKNLLHTPDFQVIYESRCMFSLISRLRGLTGTGTAYSSRWIVQLDQLLCKLFAFNRVYHPKSSLQKLRPTGYFAVLRRKTDS